MKIDNLYQDPQSESPYADSLVLDQGGMDIRYAGETIAHVSFEGLDPFEIAFHAMPDDWERHESMDGDGLGLTLQEDLENRTYEFLATLGKMQGWTRG